MSVASETVKSAVPSDVMVAIGSGSGFSVKAASPEIETLSTSRSPTPTFWIVITWSLVEPAASSKKAPRATASSEFNSPPPACTEISGSVIRSARTPSEIT